MIDFYKFYKNRENLNGYSIRLNRIPVLAWHAFFQKTFNVEELYKRKKLWDAYPDYKIGFDLLVENKIYKNGNWKSGFESLYRILSLKKMNL